MIVLTKQLVFLLVWGASFGMIEGAVVIYLREIFYPNGFTFPPLPFNRSLLFVEVCREIATLLLLWITAELTENELNKKWAVFIILFAIWDIFYYIFLKVFLKWPESLFTWDVLFLIPWVWAGPVLAPVLISLALIVAGITILYIYQNNNTLKMTALFCVGELVAGGIILSSFLIPGKNLMDGHQPGSYSWMLLSLGLVLGLGLFIHQIRTSLRNS